LPVLWRRGLRERYLLFCLAGLFLAMYVPVPFQRRLSLGFHPILAVVAGITLAQVVRLAASRWRRGIVVVVGVLSTHLTGLLLVSLFASALTNSPVPVYRVASAEEQATRWLMEHTGPEAVVMASWDTSNYLAGRLRGRVVGGHPVATLDP